MITLTQYLNGLEQSINSNHKTFFPMDHEERVYMAKYLAKGLAEGLKGYPFDKVKYEIPALYGRFHVKHCLDSVGPVVDSQEFNGLIYDIIKDHQEPRP